MKKSLLYALAVAVMASAHANEPLVHTQKVMAQGIWIDVRGADEFATEHLVGANHVPVDDIANQIATITTDKNAQINLYCRVGRRADIARAKLLELGYQNVVNHGGFKDIKHSHITSLDK